jgi:hypothetical protein
MTTHRDMNDTLSGVEEEQDDLCPLTPEDSAEILIRCTLLPDPAAAGVLLTSGVDPNLLSGDGRTAFCELLDRMDDWSDAKPDVAMSERQTVPAWDLALDIYRQMELAGARDFRELVRAAAAGSLGDVRSLVDGGMPVRFCSSRLGTALTAALENGHPEVVKFLLGKGVDPNRPAALKANASPRVYPIQLALRSEELLRLLLAAGADPCLRLPGSQGTPAVFSGTIPSISAGRMLFSIPEVRRLKDFSGRGAVHCMDVESCRACAEFFTPDDINSLSGLGRTALYEVACKADVEKAEWLLDNGANPNQLCFCRIEPPASGRRFRFVFSTPAHAALVGGLHKLAVAMAGAYLKLLNPASGSPCLPTPRPPFSPATLSWSMPLFGWNRRRLAKKLAAAGDMPASVRPRISGLPGDETFARMIHLALSDPQLLDKMLGRGAVWQWEPADAVRPQVPMGAPRASGGAACRKTVPSDPALCHIGEALLDVSEGIKKALDDEEADILTAQKETFLQTECFVVRICGMLRHWPDAIPSHRAELDRASTRVALSPGFHKNMRLLAGLHLSGRAEMNKSFTEQDAWLASYEECAGRIVEDLLEWSERIKEIAELCERAGNPSDNPPA